MKRDNTPCANEISFDVPSFADVDKGYDRAVSMGAKSIMEPTTEPWGYNQFSVSRNIDENHKIPSIRPNVSCQIDGNQGILSGYFS